MHHFESDAEQRSFRLVVSEAASNQSAPADAERAWRDLTEGGSSVLDAFTTSSWSYLVTSAAVPHPPVPPRGLLVLERVVMGSYPKVVAAELCLSQSTIASTMKQALSCIGVSCRASKIPFGLAALIHAARRDGRQTRLYSSSAVLLGQRCEILATPTPFLAHLLPPVVAEVMKLHLAGKSHREMARLRGTSSRTIANQLALAYERVGSSGRLSMLDFLLSRCDAMQQQQGAG